MCEVYNRVSHLSACLFSVLKAASTGEMEWGRGGGLKVLETWKWKMRMRREREEGGEEKWWSGGAGYRAEEWKMALFQIKEVGKSTTGPLWNPSNTPDDPDEMFLISLLPKFKEVTTNRGQLKAQLLDTVSKWDSKQVFHTPTQIYHPTDPPLANNFWNNL